MFRSMLSSALALAATASIFSSRSLAQDFDVSPAVGPDGRIITNAFQDAAETEVKNVRVFAYAFGEEEGQPLFLSDPGFHPLPGVSGFAPESVIGFDLAAPLRFWSGTGAPTFAPVTTGDAIRFDFGASSVVSTGGGVPSPAGYAFGVIDENGEFDDHLETYLLAAGGTVGSPGAPTAGIYLVTQTVTSTQAGVSSSEPIYLLFDNGAGEDALRSASVFVRDTFAPNSVLVPEPATLGVVTATLVLAGGRRRRRGELRA